MLCYNQVPGAAAIKIMRAMGNPHEQGDEGVPESRDIFSTSSHEGHWKITRHMLELEPS